MPTTFKRKRDVEEFLFVTGAQLQATALTLREAKRPRIELASGDEEDEDEDAPHVFDVDKAVADTHFNIAAGLIASACASTEDNSRGPYNQIPRCSEFFHVALTWPDKEFRHSFRMSRDTFDRLVTLLEPNPLFVSTGKKPQRPVRYQLACFLMRYSVRGGDAMLASKQLAIGLGTVFKYCERVSRALRELGLDVLTWGNEERREEIATYIHRHYGFRNCVGMVDGSLIRLTEAPAVMGLVYYCRKKYPALNMQAIVDHEGRFISFDLGWPGSVPDVTIWKQSRFWRQRRRHLTGEQYVLADKGYPSSPYTLRPFTEPEIEEVTGAERTRRYAFNQCLSSIRIRVEHAFGRLKARFPALQCLTPADDISNSYRHIHAMLVVHNICHDLDDHPDDFWNEWQRAIEEDYVGDEVDVELPAYGGTLPTYDEVGGIPGHETEVWLREMGNLKRQQMLNEMFPL